MRVRTLSETIRPAAQQAAHRVSEKTNRALSSLIAVLALTLVAAGCGGRVGTGEEKKLINSGYIAWDENLLVSHVR